MLDVDLRIRSRAEHSAPTPARCTHVIAQLRAGLEVAGTAVGAHDLRIAATAISHGYGLVTGNVRDFDRVPGLRVVAFPQDRC